MKRIAVLTSGGDCFGMNAAIRSITRTALGAGLAVLGFRRGYQGLIEGRFEKLTNQPFNNVLQRGGTILQSARCPGMQQEEGLRSAVDNLRNHGVDGLVVIGGDGSLRGGMVFHQPAGARFSEKGRFRMKTSEHEPPHADIEQQTDADHRRHHTGSAVAEQRQGHPHHGQ